MTLLPALMTTAEVANELRVHPKTVREWAKSGKLRAIKLPGQRTRRYRREDVDAILAGEQPEAAAS